MKNKTAHYESDEVTSNLVERSKILSPDEAIIIKQYQAVSPSDFSVVSVYVSMFTAIYMRSNPTLLPYIKLSKAALCYPFSYVDVNQCLHE